MNILLEYIGPILGMFSAIVTLIAFFKERIKHKIIFLASSLIFASVIVYVWDGNKQKEYDLELLHLKQEYQALILSEKQRYVSEDAQIIASSIDVYGSQTYGKYLAHLGSIVGFYNRHADLYETQYLQLSKEYEHWEKYFRNKRETNKTIYSSDHDALEGIVKSNLDLLKNIAKGSKNI